MDILKTCLDEISLSGLEGCTLEQLWHFLSNRQPPIPFKLDDFIKPIIWNHLVHCCSTGNVQMFKLPTPRDLPESVVTSVGQKQQWKEYHHPYSYRFISFQTKGVRGSCIDFDKRQEISNDIVTDQLSLTAAVERYGNSLVMITTQELRDRALTPPNQDPYCEITDVQYGLLEVVGCSRHYGIARPFITSKYIKIDARSVFHHVKVLKYLGFIKSMAQRRFTSKNRSQVTHVLYLSRYSPVEDSEVNLEEYLCSLLEEAPYKTLSHYAMHEKLGKQLKGVKSSLIRKGFIEPVSLADVAEEYADNPELSKAKGCRLLKPYDVKKGSGLVGKSVMGEDGEGLEDEEEGDLELSDRVPVMAELPLDMQGYQLIDSYGPHGISHADFRFCGLALEPSVNRLIAKSLIKRSLVFAIVLDSTSIRTIRLVSARHVSKNKEYAKLHAEKAKSGVEGLELAIMTGNNYFTPDIRSNRRPKKEVEGESSGGAPVAIPTNEPSLTPTPVSAESLQKLTATISKLSSKEGSSSKEQLQNGSEKSPVPDLVPELHSLPKLSLTSEADSHKQQPKMTYNRLRRSNIIMEYMESSKVVSDLVDLGRYVRDIEVKDGRDRVIDRKTIVKLVEQLERDGRLFHRTAELKAEVGSTTKTTPITLHFVPSATEEEIEAVLAKARNVYQSVVHRRELKDKPKEKKPKKVKKESEDESSDEGDSEDQLSQEEGDSDRESSTLIPNTISSSKFQRLKHFHYYLWILAHGNFTESHSSSTDCYQHAADADSAFILPEANFPWVSVVKKLPLSSKGEGWINFNDICQHIPLSLCVILMKIYSGQHVFKWPSKYLCYFQDSDKKNKLVHELPRKLRKSIAFAGRDVHHVCSFLTQLQDMGLLTVEGELQSKDRSNVHVHLLEHVTILDTSSAEPRRSFFSNEARHLFKDVSFTFHCLADLERYWFQLQSICLRTPIILMDTRGYAKHGDKGFGTKELHSGDLYPLSYSATPQIQKLKHTRMEYNSQGFGAAGLPPLTFSHLNRNWNLYSVFLHEEDMFSIKPPNDRMGEVGESGSRSSYGPGGSRSSYGPGVSLSKIPRKRMLVSYSSDEEDQQQHNVMEVDVESGSLEEWQDNDVEQERGRGSATPSHDEEREHGDDDGAVPAAKMQRLMSSLVTVPSDQVKPHSGGKGRSRFRLKNKPAAPKRSKDTSVSSRYRVAQNTLSVLVDVEDPKMSTGKERTHWHPQEDSFLLSAYMASVILNRKRQPAVSYTKIRDAISRQFPKAKLKSSSSVKRRLTTMMRKKKALSSNIELCVTECLQEMDTLGVDAPEPMFESILEFVYNKYRSQSGNIMFSQGSLLPSSLSDLIANYEVVGDSELREVLSLPCVEGSHEIDQALVTHLIIAALGADETTYDHYTAFKLFESFSERDVKVAFDLLKNQYLIKQKRSIVLGVPRKKGPLESQSYDLSANFFSRLEQHFSQELFQEMRDFKTFIRHQQKLDTIDNSSCDSTDVSCDPAIKLVGKGLIRLEGEPLTPRRGSVVGVVQSALKNNSVISCQTNLPSPLFEPLDNLTTLDTPLSLEEDMDEENEDARQLLKSALETKDYNSDEEEDEPMESSSLREAPSTVGAGKERETATGTDTNEDLGSCQGQSSAGRLGGGLRVLFQVGAGVMNYGFLDVEPSLNIGCLLEPEDASLSLTSARKESKQDGVTSKATTSGGSLSIQGFLNICKEKLDYSEDDICFSKQLYDVIHLHGNSGIPKSTVMSHPQLCSLKHHQLSMEQHIQTLLNMEMVHTVGITDELLVSHAHSNRWSMSVEGVTKGGAPFISFHPWSTISSCDPNTPLLERYQCGVLSYIMGHPGVTLNQLAQHFSGMLHLNSLKKILKALEYSDEIKSHTLHCPMKCGPFSDSCQNIEGHVCRDVEYFEPK